MRCDTCNRPQDVKAYRVIVEELRQCGIPKQDRGHSFRVNACGMCYRLLLIAIEKGVGDEGEERTDEQSPKRFPS